MTRHRHKGTHSHRHAADPDLSPPASSASKHRGDYPRGLTRLADRTEAAAAELLALAVPVCCVCCGAEDLVLCATCARQIRLLTRNPFRAEAQAPALMDMDGSVLLPVVAAGVYRAELAQALLSFKRYGQMQLGRVLAQALGGAVSAALGEPAGVWLVPVPTGNSAFRKRGFSPVHVLLRRFSRDGTSGPQDPAGPRVVDALRKAGVPRRAACSGTPPLTPSPPGFLIRLLTGAVGSLAGGQKGLGRGARSQRVRGSMRVRSGPRAPELRGQPIIIIDDVLTTGATLAEAARALQRSGGLVRGAVVLAATRPPVASDFASGHRTAVGKAGVKEKNKPKKDE